MASRELFETTHFNDTDLISYYRLEADALDAKGGNNGSATDITYGTANGRFAQGAGFNGSSSSISASTPIVAGSSYTIATWFKYTVIGMVWEGQSGSQPSLEPAGSDAVRFYVNNNQSIISPTLATSTWYHITCIWNEATSEMKMFVDGTLVETKSDTTDDAITTIYMGSRLGAAIFLTGSLDDFAIFDRALESHEVYSLAQGAGTGVFIL